MATRVPTPGMQKMYAEKKQITLSKIEACIDEMREWGEEVTKKRIIERTGISSGTLSKPYVLDLLRRKEVCQFKPIAKTKSSSSPRIEKELSKRIKEIEVLEHKLSDSQDMVITLRDRIITKEKEISSLKDTIAHLRGQQQLLLERLDSSNVGIGNIILEK